MEKSVLVEYDNGSTISSVSDDSRAERRHRRRRSVPGSRHSNQLTRSISEIRDGIQSRREVELGEPLEKQPTPRAQAPPNLVTWDHDDPENPKTWPFGKKWAAVTIVSFFALISPVSSTMTAPALGVIGQELNITSEFEKELSLSIFVLGKSVPWIVHIIIISIPI